MAKRNGKLKKKTRKQNRGVLISNIMNIISSFIKVGKCTFTSGDIKEGLQLRKQLVPEKNLARTIANSINRLGLKFTSGLHAGRFATYVIKQTTGVSNIQETWNSTKEIEENVSDIIKVDKRKKPRCNTANLKIYSIIRKILIKEISSGLTSFMPQLIYEKLMRNNIEVNRKSLSRLIRNALYDIPYETVILGEGCRSGIAFFVGEFYKKNAKVIRETNEADRKKVYLRIHEEKIMEPQIFKIKHEKEKKKEPKKKKISQSESEIVFEEVVHFVKNKKDSSLREIYEYIKDGFGETGYSSFKSFSHSIAEKLQKRKDVLVTRGSHSNRGGRAPLLFTINSKGLGLNKEELEKVVTLDEIKKIVKLDKPEKKIIPMECRVSTLYEFLKRNHDGEEHINPYKLLREINKFFIEKEQANYKHVPPADLIKYLNILNQENKVTCYGQIPAVLTNEFTGVPWLSVGNIDVSFEEDENSTKPGMSVDQKSKQLEGVLTYFLKSECTKFSLQDVIVKASELYTNSVIFEDIKPNITPILYRLKPEWVRVGKDSWGEKVHQSEGIKKESMQVKVVGDIQLPRCNTVGDILDMVKDDISKWWKTIMDIKIR